MKNTVFLLFFLTFLSTICFSNEAISKLTETQIKTLLCHKWKLTFLEYKGKKKEIPSKLPESILVFLSDGNLQEFEGAKKYDGKWTYNHLLKTVITEDKDGTENHKIIALNNEEFVMNGKYKGFTFNMGLKRLD